MDIKPQPEIIITSHANADFDALAAMVAAGKLYAQAVLVAPTTPERQGRHYFADSIVYAFNIHNPKDVDFSTVHTLVVVDTRQRARIPHVEAVFANPGLRIHLYDHHPDAKDDLQGEVCVVKPWGAATSILVHMMRDKGIVPTEEEATMLGLGIYEDTGSFMFSSSTPHDFAAAGWLCEQKMDLEIISNLLTHELTRDQVLILNALLEAAIHHDIKGIAVVITDVSLDSFIGDFAVLVHKMIDMEQLRVVFALGRMGDKIQVVARSRLAEVDVGKICASLGGGGHSFAASASVKERTLAEVKAELLALLMSSVNPQITVGQHMSSPVQAVEDNANITAAEEMMNRYGLKAVPVLAAGTQHLVGYLEQQTAARAVAHGLGGLGVSEYMHRNVQTVTPYDSLFPAMEIILNQRQRLVPVMLENKVIGVLTRTDIIRLLVSDNALRIPEGNPLAAPLRERNICPQIEERLPKNYTLLLRRIGSLADSLGCCIYAVGGFVRDLLLYRQNLDIDVSVEGDGIAFAKALAKELKGRVRVHNKFKTGIVIFTNETGEEQRIDVATARIEYYEHPGALPTVELSSIKMDLFRRDFTINALAVQLNAARFGMLVDPFGAQRDIKEKTVNVLHSLSFVEDPTRVLRAIRFEKRFHFRLGAQTERLIKNVLQLGMMEKLSGQRIFNELQHLFEEKEAVACILRLESFDLLRTLHPLLKLNPQKIPLLKEAESVLSWYQRLYTGKEAESWIVFMLVLCRNGKYPEVSAALERFGFTQRTRSSFLRLRESIRQTTLHLDQWKETGGSMSALYALLARMPVEGILYLVAFTSETEVSKDISHFLTKIYLEKTDITGDDLLYMGLEPGPLLGNILNRVLAAKLDGQVKTREEQLQLAEQLMLHEKEGRYAKFALPEVLGGRT